MIAPGNVARLAALGIAALLLLPAPPSPAARRGSTALILPVKKRDLGAVETGRIASTTFPIRNGGGRTLHLEIEGECGCTTARGPKFLSPGAAGQIYVRFQPQALWSGKMEKAISITTDEPGRPEAELKLAVDVIPYIRILPNNPVVVKYEPGGRYHLDVGLVPRAGRGVTISPPAKPPSPLVQAKLSPASEGVGYHLHLDVGPVPGPGDLEETILLPTSEPHVALLPVVVDILAAKGPVVSPRELYAPAIDPTDGAMDLTKFQVFTRSGQIRLLGIDTGNPHLAARVAEKNPGRAYEVTLRYLGGWRSGGIDTGIKVRTDDPRAPLLTVPFHILVR